MMCDVWCEKEDRDQCATQMMCDVALEMNEFSAFDKNIIPSNRFQADNKNLLKWYGMHLVVKS